MKHSIGWHLMRIWVWIGVMIVGEQEIPLSYRNKYLN